MKTTAIAVFCALLAAAAVEVGNCLELTWGDPIEQRWNVLRSEATRLDHQGDWPEALRTAKLALTKADVTFGPMSLQAAKSHILLGNLYAKRGKFVSAEIHYNKGIGLLSRLLGPEHPIVVRPMALLAALYEGKGRTMEAESAYHKAVVICEGSDAVDDTTMVEALRGLARVSENAGRLPESEQLLVKALRTSERNAHSLRPSEPVTGLIMAELGDNHIKQGNVLQAIRYYKRAVTELERYKTDPVLVCSVWNCLGKAYTQIGSSSLACDAFNRGAALRSKMMLLVAATPLESPGQD